MIFNLIKIKIQNKIFYNLERNINYNNGVKNYKIKLKGLFCSPINFIDMRF